MLRARARRSACRNSRSPASARCAASMSRLVTPLMAETTTTTGLRAAAAFTMAAARRDAICIAHRGAAELHNAQGRHQSPLFSRRFMMDCSAVANVFKFAFHTHDLHLILVFFSWSCSLGAVPVLNPNIVSELATVESSIVQPEPPRRTGVRGVHAYNRALVIRGISRGSAVPQRPIDSTMGQICAVSIGGAGDMRVGEMRPGEVQKDRGA